MSEQGPVGARQLRANCEAWNIKSLLLSGAKDTALAVDVGINGALCPHGEAKTIKYEKTD